MRFYSIIGIFIFSCQLMLSPVWSAEAPKKAKAPDIEPKAGEVLKIFYGLALLVIPLAIILDTIGGIPQPLLFFLAAVAIFPSAVVCPGFLAAPDLAGRHKVGVSVASLCGPQRFP